MPRRRMIHPDFWKDPEVAKLTIPERLLFIGVFSNADDEGRIIATPESLKADIFPYDHKMTARVVKKMRDSLVGKMKNLLLYDNDNVEYIVLLRWNNHQKPKHFKPSRLPPPPTPLYDERETSSPPEGETPGFPSLGQSSQGKDSLGKGSIGSHNNFNFKYKSDTDLTDYLTTSLKDNIPRGAVWGSEVITQFWEQCIGKPASMVFQGALAAVKSYSPEIIAQALIKAKTYGAGKHHTWKYVAEILKELTSKGKQ